MYWEPEVDQLKGERALLGGSAAVPLTLAQTSAFDCLVSLQAHMLMLMLLGCTIVIYLVVLDLAAHHAEGVVARVVVDVDSAEARGASSWDPLPVSIIVHHDSSPSLADALFTVETQSRSSEHTHTLTLH